MAEQKKTLPMNIKLDAVTLKIWIKSFILDMFPEHDIEKITLTGPYDEDEADFIFEAHFNLEKIKEEIQ